MTVDEVAERREYRRLNTTLAAKPGRCATCGDAISGRPHKRYCGKACRREAWSAERRQEHLAHMARWAAANG